MNSTEQENMVETTVTAAEVTETTVDAALEPTLEDIISGFEGEQLPEGILEQVAKSHQAPHTVVDAEEAEAEKQPQDDNESAIESKTETDQEGETEESPEESQVTDSAQILALARREKKLREAEESLDERVKAQVQQELATVTDQLQRDPVKYLLSVGIPEDKLHTIAEQIFYNQLEEDAPPEYKQRRQELEMENKLREMEQRQKAWEEQQAQAAAQRQYDQYVGQIEGYLQALPPDMTYLQKEFQHDSDATLTAMIQGASAIFEQTGAVPTAEEVATALNTELERYITRFQPANTKATRAAETTKVPTKATTQATKTAEPKTLTSNMDTSGSPDMDDPDYYQRKAVALIKGQ